MVSPFRTVVGVLILVALSVACADKTWKKSGEIQMKGLIGLMSEVPFYLQNGITYNYDTKSFILNSQQYILSSPAASSFGHVSNTNEFPLTDEMRQKYGYDHIGDIDYIGSDMFVASLEEYTYSSPAMAIYNATTLEIMSYFPTYRQAHNPWVARQPNTEFLFSSEFSHVQELVVYKVESWNPLKFYNYATLRLANTTLEGVQGGAFDPTRDNFLYLSANYKDSIYEVDIITGEVTTIIEGGDDREMEGVCYSEGTIMFFENYGPKCSIPLVCPKYIQAWTET